MRQDRRLALTQNETLPPFIGQILGGETLHKAPRSYSARGPCPRRLIARLIHTRAAARDTHGPYNPVATQPTTDTQTHKYADITDIHTYTHTDAQTHRHPVPVKIEQIECSVWYVFKTGCHSGQLNTLDPNPRFRPPAPVIAPHTLQGYCRSSHLPPRYGHLGAAR